MVNEALVQRAVAIVKGQDYVAFDVLCKKLKCEFGTFGKKKLYSDLQHECNIPNGQIGEVDKERAKKALLQEQVFYSLDWANREVGPQTIEEKIGSHLYQRILKNQWNNYGSNNGLNFHTLNQEGFGWIIVHGEGFTGSGYLWNEFVSKYGSHIVADKGVTLEKTRRRAEKERLRGIRELERGLKQLDLELVNSLYDAFLNEKLHVAVRNSATQETLVTQGQKLTRSLLKRIAKCRGSITIEDPILMAKFEKVFLDFQPRFNELEKKIEELKK